MLPAISYLLTGIAGMTISLRLTVGHTLDYVTKSHSKRRPVSSSGRELIRNNRRFTP